MYKLFNDQEGNPVSVSTEKNGVYLSIPFDPDNTDYQKYLEWLAEGNTPEPADN